MNPDAIFFPLDTNAHQFSNQPAVIWGSRQISWQHLKQYVLSTVKTFKQLGIKPLDRVAIVDANRVEYVIVLLALLVASVTGFVFQRLEQRGLLEPNPHTVEVAAGFSIWKDLGRRFRQRSWDLETFLADFKGIARGSWGLAQMVLLWVAIGFTVSALIGNCVPHGWWSRYFGPTLPGLLLTLGVATAVEVCSEGTAPLAVEIYRQTAALGNAFVFLMAGVVTDFTELSLVWANIGKKAVFWLVVVTVPQVVAVGLLMNYLLK